MKMRKRRHVKALAAYRRRSETKMFFGVALEEFERFILAMANTIRSIGELFKSIYKKEGNVPKLSRRPDEKSGV